MPDKIKGLMAEKWDLPKREQLEDWHQNGFGKDNEVDIEELRDKMLERGRDLARRFDGGAEEFKTERGLERLERVAVDPENYPEDSHQIVCEEAGDDNAAAIKIFRDIDNIIQLVVYAPDKGGNYELIADENALRVVDNTISRRARGHRTGREIVLVDEDDIEHVVDDVNLQEQISSNDELTKFAHPQSDGQYIDEVNGIRIALTRLADIACGLNDIVSRPIGKSFGIGDDDHKHYWERDGHRTFIYNGNRYHLYSHLDKIHFETLDETGHIESSISNEFCGPTFEDRALRLEYANSSLSFRTDEPDFTTISARYKSDEFSGHKDDIDAEFSRKIQHSQY